ncbi:MAG: MCE family protein [Phycisphaerales bacterium]|nr:MCE family protein [Phycisphaerales bacterium]
MKGKFARDFFTGLTALGGVAGLVVMLALFGELREVGQRFYAFTLRMDTAGGLSSTSHVTLNGVRVGTISELANDADPTRGVALTVRVKEGTRIPASFEVYIDKSLVGDATLDLIARAGAAPEVNFINPGDVVERRAKGLFDLLSASIREPLERFSKTADSIDQLAATYNSVGQNLNDLLGPRTPADVDAGQPPNLRSAVARVDSALDGANRWLGDEQMREDVRSAAARASALMDDATRTAEAWRQTAASVDERVASAGAKIEATADQAAATLRSIDEAAGEVRQLSRSINAGEGTLGQLARNPDLYNSMRDAAKRLERALTEFQLMIEKYKAEGIPLKL